MPGRGRARAGPTAAAAALLAAAALVLPPSPAVAQDRPASSWREEKCARYGQAWSEALARFGREGLGGAFLDRHAAFLAAGCPARREVCPRSPAELAIADALTVAAVNARIPGSFLPFACRD